MSATSVDAKSEIIKLMPSGASMRPSSPERKNKGMKLTTMISVELSMGIRTSPEAWNMISIFFFRASLGRRALRRKRLKTFSTSTMASSTNDPMAMAIPPMLIVLMVSPIAFNTSIVMSSEMGMVTSEISVVRAFIKKMKRMSTTKMPPSTSDF